MAVKKHIYIAYNSSIRMAFYYLRIGYSDKVLLIDHNLLLHFQLIEEDKLYLVYGVLEHSFLDLSFSSSSSSGLNWTNTGGTEFDKKYLENALILSIMINGTSILSLSFAAYDSFVSDSLVTMETVNFLLSFSLKGLLPFS